MSLTFNGWETLFDGKRRLKPGQAPKRGRGYTMFHGTHKSNAKAIITSGFKPSAGGTLGPGVYCSRDLNKATAYPALCPQNDRVVFRLLVRVGKVKRIDGQSMNLINTWHQNGYDTAWLPSSMGRPEEDCVWDPKRLTVVGIEHCTDTQVKNDLENLIKQRGKGVSVSATPSQAECKICGKSTQPQTTHVLQKCWGCGTLICNFMDKHVCRGKS
ncbi:gig2-like protein DreN [Anguilla rostrata]|uniref:gig2-like protein DreN n=1 Tax=Anguilla rostrata TaxID=7938 RepID=UPI0030CDA898